MIGAPIITSVNIRIESEMIAATIAPTKATTQCAEPKEAAPQNLQN